MNELLRNSTRISSAGIALDTPALIVDEDIMRKNISEMAAYAKDHDINLRPHIKTHKTPEIAAIQMEAGAVGIMCSKLGEAEVFADSGITDIALGYQIVGSIKLARLLKLTERCQMTVALDSMIAAEPLSQIMAENNRIIDVYLEINTGHNRSGVLPGESAVELAKQVNSLPGVRIKGVMTHEGQANSSPPDTIQEKAVNAGELIVQTAEMIRAVGIPIEVVSVGSTPCAERTTSVPGITEMRPGTYVFRDVAGFRYGIYGPDRCAARYLTTVCNRPAPDRAILDAGAKTLAMDKNPSFPGHGFIVGHPTVVIDRINEEHGVVILPPDEPGFEIGDQVEIIPNHVCPSVNLHDEMTIVRNGEIVNQWRIAARGKVQ